jgi:hypothetical protein
MTAVPGPGPESANNHDSPNALLLPHLPRAPGGWEDYQLGRPGQPDGPAAGIGSTPRHSDRRGQHAPAGRTNTTRVPCRYKYEDINSNVIEGQQYHLSIKNKQNQKEIEMPFDKQVDTNLIEAQLVNNSGRYIFLILILKRLNTVFLNVLLKYYLEK